MSLPRIIDKNTNGLSKEFLPKRGIDIFVQRIYNILMAIFMFYSLKTSPMLTGKDAVDYDFECEQKD